MDAAAARRRLLAPVACEVAVMAVDQLSVCSCSDVLSVVFSGPLTDSNRRPPPYHEREEGVD
jgi:hypothetical protein